MVAGGRGRSLEFVGGSWWPAEGPKTATALGKGKQGVGGCLGLLGASWWLTVVVGVMVVAGEGRWLVGNQPGATGLFSQRTRAAGGCEGQAGHGMGLG